MYFHTVNQLNLQISLLIFYLSLLLSFSKWLILRIFMTIIKKTQKHKTQNVISNVTQDLANKNSLFFILLKKLDFFYHVPKILSHFLTTYYCKMSNHDTPYERKYAVGACF